MMEVRRSRDLGQPISAKYPGHLRLSHLTVQLAAMSLLSPLYNRTFIFHATAL